MVTIVSSRQDPSFRYYDNLAFLRNGLQNNAIHFQGHVNNHAPEAFVYNAGRTYDFTRTAKPQMRENMAAYLRDVLPGLQQEDHRIIREAFDCLFEYNTYKHYLNIVGQQRRETLNMLVFYRRDNQEYVAHVQFSSTTVRNVVNDENQYTVNATLTCQRFSYFELQETDLEDVLAALQNLHVAE